MFQIKDVILTVLSSVLLLIVYDDDEVLIDTTEKEALELRFYILFIDTSFIVMFGLRVKENESTIAVSESENIINNEVLAVYVEAVMIKDNFAAAVWTADVEVFMIKIMIEEEVRAVDIEASSMRDEIEVEV